MSTSKGSVQTGLQTMIILSIVIQTLSLALRLHFKFRLGVFGREDMLLMIAYIISIPAYACGFAVDGLGFGSATLSISLEWVELATLEGLLIYISLSLVKTSIGWTLLRIGLGKTFRNIVVVLVVLQVVGNMVYGIANVVFGIYMAQRDRWGTPTYYWPLWADRVIIGVSVGTAIIFDLGVTILPEIYLRGVKISARERLSIRLVLCAMLLATVTVAVRAYYSLQLTDESLSYLYALICLIILVELCICFVCAWLPSIVKEATAFKNLARAKVEDQSSFVSLRTMESKIGRLPDVSTLEKAHFTGSKYAYSVEGGSQMQQSLDMAHLRSQDLATECGDQDILVLQDVEMASGRGSEASLDEHDGRSETWV